MRIRPFWSTASAVALVALTLAAVPACTAGRPATTGHAAIATATGTGTGPGGAAPRITPMTDISRCAGSSSEVEWDFAGPSGQPVKLEISTRLLEPNGQQAEVEGIARDITERKRLEREL